MIWVVNATSFQDHFVISSKVRVEIGKLDAELREKRWEIQNGIAMVIRELEKKANQLEGSLRYERNKQADLHDRIQKYSLAATETERLADEALKWIIQKEMPSEFHLMSLFNHIEQQYGAELKSIMNSIHNKAAAIRKVECELESLNVLEEALVEGKLVRKVTCDMISADNYERSFVIDRMSRDSLFPIYQRIRNQADLFRYKHAADKYDFYLNLRDEIGRLQQVIAELKTDVQNYEVNRNEMRKTIATEINKWMDREIASMRFDLELVVKRVESLSTEYSREKAQLDELKISRYERVNAAIEALEKEHYSARRSKMKNNKGLYLYKWKYERKTWREASKPLFFHTGEDHLFERLHSGTFRKVSIADFIQQCKFPYQIEAVEQFNC